LEPFTEKVHAGFPRKGPAWATVALPPKEAVTVEVGTLAQTSELLGDGEAVEVAVGVADPPAGCRAGDAEGDVEEQAARPDSATTRAATPALDGRRNGIDTIVADSRRAGPLCQGR
jgi:hypothetical protein